MGSSATWQARSITGAPSWSRGPRRMPEGSAGQGGGPMPDAPKQLAFDLPLDPRYGREDFLVSPSNERAYGLIERWPDWPDRVLRLAGPKGSGKSHLASIWATSAHAWTIDAFE